jgi:putative acetyltransferase
LGSGGLEPRPGKLADEERGMVRSATENGTHEKASVTIVRGGLDDPRVRDLLEHHARTARQQTAVGSAHVLDLEALKSIDVTFWSAWHDTKLVGVGALKCLSPTHGEIKSMHTVHTSRRLGIGSAMLRHIVEAARANGMTRLSLETGSWAYFDHARALYRNQGFVECPPFGEYVEDPNSVFMMLDLAIDELTP